MVVFSLLKEAAGALWANRLRSGLTIVGMIMGVASVIAIVSAVEGMQAEIENTLMKFGPNSFMVGRFGMTMSAAEYLERLKRKKLTRELIGPIENGCPDCEEVGAEGYTGAHLSYNGRRMRWVTVQGETPNGMDIRAIELIMGRSFTWEEERRCRQVGYIGNKVYEQLFAGENPVGRRIRVGRHEFTVIGVAEKMDSEIVHGMDDFIIIPLSTLQRLWPQPGNPVNLTVKAVSLERREAAIDQVRTVMRSIRQVPYEEDDDFEILTPDAILSVINDITRAFRVLMVSLPLLSIVVGGIVIMNIMMISVTERTREIGIRKSIGASRRLVLLQFLYESVILSLTGGLIGVVIGVELGRWILTSVMDIFLTPTTMAVILGFGISTAVGLFFGLYPAMKAARLDPIKALSYESLATITGGFAGGRATGGHGPSRQQIP